MAKSRTKAAMVPVRCRGDARRRATSSSDLHGEGQVFVDLQLSDADLPTSCHRRLVDGGDHEPDSVVPLHGKVRAAMVRICKEERFIRRELRHHDRCAAARRSEGDGAGRSIAGGRRS